MKNIIRSSPLFAVLLGLGACAEEDDGAGNGPSDIPDSSQAGLEQFLADEGFADWAAEPEPRPPIPGSGSPHGTVRVYFSPLLEDSLSNFDGRHPVGAAAVKEVYDTMDQITNYFIYVKTVDEDGPGSFVWYRQNTPQYFDGDSFCGDCHAATDGNLDTTITPLP